MPWLDDIIGFIVFFGLGIAIIIDRKSMKNRLLKETPNFFITKSNIKESFVEVSLVVFGILLIVGSLTCLYRLISLF